MPCIELVELNSIHVTLMYSYLQDYEGVPVNSWFTTAHSWCVSVVSTGNVSAFYWMGAGGLSSAVSYSTS